MKESMQKGVKLFSYGVNLEVILYKIKENFKDFLKNLHERNGDKKRNYGSAGSPKQILSLYFV
jgi:hypothetical protein